MSTATDPRRRPPRRGRRRCGDAPDRRPLPSWAWVIAGRPRRSSTAISATSSTTACTTSITTTLAYVMMALGLNIVVGFAGLLDLGYVAFYAIGAFVAGWFMSHFFADSEVHILVRRSPKSLPGHPHQLLLRRDHRRGVHARCGARSSARRRCACAATTWRS